MTSTFLQFGNDFLLSTQSEAARLKLLPAGLYTVRHDNQRGYYLTIADMFTVPTKIYADLTKTTDRIVQTYLARTGNTGVLLEGEKGSGKSLIAKLVIQRLLNLDIATIVVNEPYNGVEFDTFINSIPGRVAVLFDEFEKVYEQDDQRNLLTLFDGTGTASALFLLTVNDTYSLDTNLKNRPGRMYYRLTFSGIEPAFVREYCDENLKNKEHLEDVVKYVSLLATFNFDMLQALIEEMNRYGEDSHAALKFLNVTTTSGEEHLDVKIFENELPGHTYDDQVHLDPLEHNGFTLRVHYPDSDRERSNIKFYIKDLVKVDAHRGEYTYESKNFRCVLSRPKIVRYAF